MVGGPHDIGFNYKGGSPYIPIAWLAVIRYHLPCWADPGQEALIAAGQTSHHGGGLAGARAWMHAGVCFNQLKNHFVFETTTLSLLWGLPRPLIHRLDLLADPPSPPAVSNSSTCRRTVDPFKGHVGKPYSIYTDGSGVKLIATMGTGGFNHRDIFIRAIHVQKGNSSAAAVLQKLGNTWLLRGGCCRCMRVSMLGKRWQ